MLPSVYPDPHMLRQELVCSVRSLMIFPIDCCRIAPLGRALLFAFSGKERKAIPVVVFNALLFGFLISAAERYL